MNQRKKSRYRWPYNKHRMGRISAADRLSQEASSAADPILLSGSAETGGDAWMAVRRCARKFERSGSLYSQAGLGLAAATAFLGAAKCWDFVGESGHADGCREAAKSVDVV